MLAKCRGLVASRAAYGPLVRQSAWHVRSARHMGEQDSISPRAAKVLETWFGPGWQTMPRSAFESDAGKEWFRPAPGTDERLTAEFGSDLENAEQLFQQWQHGYNALALILLADQMSRNVYRGSARMFALDEPARRLSKQLLDSGDAQQFPPLQRFWVVMPFMHSEALADQQEGVRQFGKLVDECKAMGPEAEGLAGFMGSGQTFAIKHQEVIEKWGRFPHRNELLSRQSTPEEAAGLADGSIPRF